MAGRLLDQRSPSRLQEETQERVAKCVDERPLPVDLPTPRESIRVLLGAKADYETEPGHVTLAPFQG